MCFVFAHAVGTTDRDASARRQHAHVCHCEQCGVEVTAATRVAAHVVAYPCANPCCGYLTLRTTCRSCNARHRVGSPSTHGRWFWSCGFSAKLERLTSCMCVPVCTRYDASRVSPGVSRA